MFDFCEYSIQLSSVQTKVEAYLIFTCRGILYTMEYGTPGTPHANFATNHH